MKGMSTYLAQMTIYSLAIGGSSTKYLPSLSSDVEIMNVNGFLPMSSLEDEVEVSISKFEKLDTRQVISMFKMMKWGWRKYEMSIYRSGDPSINRNMEDVCLR